jgi:hypothetical protein
MQKYILFFNKKQKKLFRGYCQFKKNMYFRGLTFSEKN